MSTVEFPGGPCETQGFRRDDRPTETTMMGPFGRIAHDLTHDEEYHVALATDLDDLHLAARWFRMMCLGVEVSWSCADPTAARLMTVKAPGQKAMSFAALDGEGRAEMLRRLCALVERWAGVAE
jgi:hypothetical protein